jgi:hypothetical protein
MPALAFHGNWQARAFARRSQGLVVTARDDRRSPGLSRKRHGKRAAIGNRAMQVSLLKDFSLPNLLGEWHEVSKRVHQRMLTHPLPALRFPRNKSEGMLPQRNRGRSFVWCPVDTAHSSTGKTGRRPCRQPPEWAGTARRRNCKRRNSRLPLASAPLCIPCIRRKTGRRPSAWFRRRCDRILDM